MWNFVHLILIWMTAEFAMTYRSLVLVVVMGTAV